MKLLGTNTKIDKTNKYHTKYLTYILSLASHKTSGYNVCAEASKACAADCLYYSGMGVYRNVQAGRVRKTKLFFENREEFIRQLDCDLESVIKKADKENKIPAVRLNGLSDLQWETLVPHVFDYPIQFWDYSKIRNRFRKYLDGKLPENYHLTFSRSENNEKECLEFLKAGGNVAVIGNKRPRYWNDYITIDGDVSDNRFLDKPQRVVWLKPKGRMKKDISGMVIRNS